jgi:hypothetical protein
LALHGERRFGDDGWSVRTFSTLTVRLRRLAVRTTSYSFPRLG